MLILIKGGAASGKSAWAETTALQLHEKAWISCSGQANPFQISPYDDHAAREKNGPRLYYLATMHKDADDPETMQRIRRHQELRAGKGFRTIERERDIGTVCEGFCPGDTVLIEDLPNLLANELFSSDGPLLFDAVNKTNIGHTGGSIGESSQGGRMCLTDRMAMHIPEAIAQPILDLQRRGIQVVVVSGRIAEGSLTEPDPMTMHYMHALELLHRELAGAADRVTDVICGIPVDA